MSPDSLAPRRESPARRRGARSGSLRRLLAVIKKVYADHVQRGLRSLPADGFAVAGEAHATFFDSAAMRERDVYRSNGLFFRSSARPGNPRDAYAKRAARAPANSFRQRHRDFRANRALGRNEFRGHSRPSRLQLVAVADHSAKKIRR